MVNLLAAPKSLSVGERYRIIRLSHNNDQPNDQRKYWNLVNKHGGMRDALDSLLPFQCLWSGMRLSTLHKIFAMRCDDLIVNYLQHIRSVWGYILNEDAQLIEKMDHASVRVMELTCPSMSESDTEKISKRLCCEALSEQQQAELKSRVFRLNTLIPSFGSVFEDFEIPRSPRQCAKESAPA